MQIDRAALDQMLEQVKPTQPLNVDDSIAIFNLIKPMLTKGCHLDVMHDKTAIHVRVYDGCGLIAYERKLEADGQPTGIASAAHGMTR
jgi:hypothetical protein